MASFYLAGPIDYVADAGLTARDEDRLATWPDVAVRQLGGMGDHLVYVPHFAFGGTPRAEPGALRKINMAALDACDAVLAAIWPEVPSWGTPMEIMAAEGGGKAVVLWMASSRRDSRMPAYLAHLPFSYDLGRACSMLADMVAQQAEDCGGSDALLTSNGGAISAPQYGGDAGYDIRAIGDVLLSPGDWAKIPCGAGGKELRIAVPQGMWACPFARSSMAQRGFMVAPTVIEQYRGPIFVFAFNASDRAIEIKGGERIGQLVMFHLLQPPLMCADHLPASQRGENGFGSTGRE